MDQRPSFYESSLLSWKFTSQQFAVKGKYTFILSVFCMEMGQLVFIVICVYYIRMMIPKNMLIVGIL